MIKKNIIILIIVFILSFQSCENLTEPGEITFNNSVLINLKTGNSSQQFFVYKTLPLEYSFKDPPLFINLDEVFDPTANILISNDEITFDKFQISFKDSLTKNRCYTNSEEFFIETNQQYSIKIEAHGQVMTGEIVTTDEFEILGINQNENDDEDNLYYDIHWSRCSNARFYQLAVTEFYKDSIIIGYKDDEFIWDLVNLKRENTYFLNPDTLIYNNSYSYLSSVNSKCDSILVKITAFDLNTFNHLFNGIKRVGVENAYGYVGSSTTKSLKKIIK